MTDDYKEIGGTEEEDNLITLVDEDGSETLFYHIGTVAYEDKLYCVLQLAEPENEDEEDEVAIYEITGEEPNQILEPIDDEDLMQAVFDKFCDEYERYEDEE